MSGIMAILTLFWVWFAIGLAGYAVTQVRKRRWKAHHHQPPTDKESLQVRTKA